MDELDQSAKGGKFCLKIHKIKERTLKRFKKWLNVINSKDSKNNPELVYNENDLMLFPPQGLGDILLTCALLKEYKKNNPGKNIVLLVQKKHFYDLVKLYPNEMCDTVLYKEDPHNFSFIKFLDKEIYANKTFYDLCTKNKSFKSLFTTALNIGEDTKPYYPPIEEVKDDSLSKTILIAPDAVSCFNVMNDDMWLTLAKTLRAKGYEVVFNCGKKKRFPGFPKVFWDIKTTIQKANNMKAVISYRSGLADVIGAFCKNTPQYVIYPSKNIHNMGNFESEEAGVKAYFDFCSIKNTFDNNLVNEYIFDDNVIKTIVDEIG